MSTPEQPLVSVVTPVYNGEAFLAQCIESVLKQTHQNYEYIIVNNCSADRTLQIALDYAQKHGRIRVHNNEKFVAVIANHNIAFGLISREAKYCKVVSADDFLSADCITRMVELAEANPSVGIVGAYQLSGDRVRWQGFRYPRAVLPGVEMCRQVLLGGDKAFGFGTPTSTLYRADLVRSSAAFYPNESPHSDTSACFRCLSESDYGFVYEVLSYETTHEETQSWKSEEINRYSSAILNDLICYGPAYLNQDELQHQVKLALTDYHRFLSVNYFVGFRDKEFWDYHRRRLKELGYPLKRIDLVKSAVIKGLGEIANPGQAIGKLWRHLRPKVAPASVKAVRPSSGAERTS